VVKPPDAARVESRRFLSRLGSGLRRPPVERSARTTGTRSALEP